MNSITETIIESSFLALPSSRLSTNRREKKLVLKKLDSKQFPTKYNRLFDDSTSYLNTDSNVIVGKNCFKYLKVKTRKVQDSMKKTSLPIQ